MNRLQLKDLKVGNIFYECQYGINIEFEVSEVPVSSTVNLMGKERTQWTWKAKTKKGIEEDFLLTEGLEHYGPKLYRAPQYVKVRKDGSLYYPGVDDE